MSIPLGTMVINWFIEEDPGADADIAANLQFIDAELEHFDTESNLLKVFSWNKHSQLENSVTTYATALFNFDCGSTKKAIDLDKPNHQMCLALLGYGTASGGTIETTTATHAGEKESTAVGSDLEQERRSTDAIAATEKNNLAESVETAKKPSAVARTHNRPTAEDELLERAEGKESLSNDSDTQTNHTRKVN